MDVIRNVSSQPIILQKKQGVTIHLLPGRAMSLSVEEQQSAQVQNLLQLGLVQCQTLTPSQGKEAARSKEKPEAKKAEAKNVERKPESPAPQGA